MKKDLKLDGVQMVQEHHMDWYWKEKEKRSKVLFVLGAILVFTLGAIVILGSAITLHMI